MFLKAYRYKVDIDGHFEDGKRSYLGKSIDSHMYVNTLYRLSADVVDVSSIHSRIPVIGFVKPPASRSCALV